jgi:hypothetical protein
MSERVESPFVAYVQALFQKVSIEDGAKALVGYLATRNPSELLQSLPSGTVRQIHEEALNRLSTGQQFPLITCKG